MVGPKAKHVPMPSRTCLRRGRQTPSCSARCCNFKALLRFLDTNALFSWRPCFLANKFASHHLRHVSTETRLRVFFRYPARRWVRERITFVYVQDAYSLWPTCFAIHVIPVLHEGVWVIPEKVHHITFLSHQRTCMAERGPRKPLEN